MLLVKHCICATDYGSFSCGSGRKSDSVDGDGCPRQSSSWKNIFGQASKVFPRAVLCWHCRKSARQCRAQSVHTRLGHAAAPKDSAMVEPSQSTSANSVWFESGVRHQSARPKGCLLASAHCAATAHTVGLFVWFEPAFEQAAMAAWAAPLCGAHGQLT